MVNDNKLREKIVSLTSTLEDEMNKLKAQHLSDLTDLRTTYIEKIQDLHISFEQRWENIHNLHLERLMELESQVNYLKELNDAQHIMLKDYLEYIRTLESKVQTSGDSGNNT